jgi:hypothetical protein
MNRPSPAIDAEERAWAAECLSEGDSLADIAQASGRSLMDWALLFPHADRGYVPSADQLAQPAVGGLPAAGGLAALPWQAAFEALFRLAPMQWQRPAQVQVRRLRDTTTWSGRFRSPDGAICRLKTRVRDLEEGGGKIIEQHLAVFHPGPSRRRQA